MMNNDYMRNNAGCAKWPEMNNKLMHRVGDPRLMQISLDELNGRMVGVSQQIAQNTALTADTNANLLKTGEAVQHQLSEVERKMEVALRKKRHKKVGSQMATVSTGEIVLIHTYDDGDQEIDPFIINMQGEIQIAKICFPDLKIKAQYFAVGFPGNGMMIMLEEKQIKPRTLYLEFVAAGVIFNPVLSKKQIEDALFGTIAPRARYTQQDFLIPAKNGWYNGKFYTQDDTCRGLKLLPLMRKRMVQVELTAEEINLYFAEMRQICSPENRILIALTTFAGLLGTLLNEEGLRENICLNFVEVKKGMKPTICSWLQTYERDQLMPKRVLSAQSKNEKYMREMKDGVFIWDGTCEEGSSYEKNIMRSNLSQIAKITTGESAMLGDFDGKYSFATVLISSGFLRQRGVFDLVFDDSFWHETAKHDRFTKSHALDAVLSSFVKYAEKNQDSIREMANEREKRADKSLELLYIVHEIAKKFWEIFGIDFDCELGVPDISKTDNLLFEDEGADDLMEDFVSAVRKNISHFQLSPKRYGAEYKNFTIVYDKEFLWIPSTVLKKIVSMAGLFPDLSRILFNLKQAEQLICDSEGFSRKLQIGGKRGEYYQIRRELFNRQGSADITELGKE
ncbi:hypothetical protein [Mediterraneibacter glycyrrhizinilyticus]|uniref:hypothetical protein n=1 Tax=Mediterraneibacter glycyrrhizinilyticus TaxID=342942 RepID=UPI001960A575|nr:hypothetical protein [Mediterraneibacter glycyrrhizinilyticus]